MLQPSGEIKTSFTEAVERFDKVMEGRKTIYEKYMTPLEEWYF
jgi:hypothetical protein